MIKFKDTYTAPAIEEADPKQTKKEQITITAKLPFTYWRRMKFVIKNSNPKINTKILKVQRAIKDARPLSDSNVFGLSEAEQNAIYDCVLKMLKEAMTDSNFADKPRKAKRLLRKLPSTVLRKEEIKTAYDELINRIATRKVRWREDRLIKTATRKGQLKDADTKEKDLLTKYYKRFNNPRETAIAQFDHPEAPVVKETKTKDKRKLFARKKTVEPVVTPIVEPVVEPVVEPKPEVKPEKKKPFENARKKYAAWKEKRATLKEKDNIYANCSRKDLLKKLDEFSQELDRRKSLDAELEQINRQLDIYKSMMATMVHERMPIQERKDAGVTL